MTAIRCHYNEPAAPEYLALRQLAKMGKRSLEGAEKLLGMLCLLSPCGRKTTV